MNPHFSPAALKFLRGLTKHNERAWFEQRKPVYEDELKLPMLALIDEINEAMLDFAPDHVRPAHKCMMRIYRDIRFATDKRPYKTNVAAWWARRGLEKTSGGGFYLELSATGLRIAAGVYMPEKEQLFAIRTMLLDRHMEYRQMLEAKQVSRWMQPIETLKMTRGPKGFPAEHPALDLVMQRQWGVGSVMDAEVALTPALLKEVVKRFRLAAPLVELLNDPLRGPAEDARKKLF